MGAEGGLGDVESLLLVYEDRFSQLGQALQAAETRATDAQRDKAAAEAALQRARATEGEQQQAVGAEAERLRRQAERERRAAAEALAASRAAQEESAAAAASLRQQNMRLEQDSSQLAQRMHMLERQLQQLGTLRGCEEEGQQQREEELAAALERERDRSDRLEARCCHLHAELGLAGEALQAAQQLAEGSAGSSPQRRPEDRLLRRLEAPPTVGSLSLHQLADLGDLEGATSLFASPSRSQPECDAGLRQHEVGQMQMRWQQDQQAAALVASLQQQLLEQRRQLALQQQLERQQAQQQHEESESPAWQALPQAVGERQQAAGARQHELECQLGKLQKRNASLQSALAESSLQHSRAAVALQRQLQQLQGEVGEVRQQRDAATQQLEALQAALLAADGEDGSGSGGSHAAASQQLERLAGEVLEYGERMHVALEQNAALLQEKRRWLEQLHSAQGEAERSRAELQQLRLQRLQLAGGGQGAAAGAASSSAACAQQEGMQLLQQLFEAQAAEAALRSVLQEAREEQMGACKALSGELRRVHVLERLRLGDMQEMQRLQQRVHDLRRECLRLAAALAGQQQKQAVAAGRGKALLVGSGSMLGGLCADGGNFSIPARLA